MADEPRDLPAHPSLEWLRKAAKQHLAALRADSPSARLADAQRELARRHGFASWRRLVSFVTAVGAHGDTLRAAIRAGDVTTARRLLDEAPALASAGEDLSTRTRPSDERGMSLLHLAVAEGQEEIARLLVSRGVPLDHRNHAGRTALHDCFELGRDRIAEMLLAAGARLDACAAAAYGKHRELAALLDADPAQANDLRTGDSPLGWAAYASDVRSAEILLSRGASVKDPALARAAWAPTCLVGSVVIAELLLRHGIDPDVADERGRTPLHLVIASRLVAEPAPFVALLLAHGADPTRRDADGRSVLDELQRHLGEAAQTYFPPRTLGPRQLEPVLALLRDHGAG